MSFNKLVRFGCLFLVAVSVAQAHADAVTNAIAQINSSLTACLAKATSDVAIGGCNQVAYTAADSLLNKTYDQIVQTLQANAIQDQKDGIPASEGSAEILRRLKLSEETWISYRDTDCNFQATEMLGGTGEPLVYSSCEVKKELNRTKEIDQVENGQN